MEAWLQALVLGVIQGLTEFLPVSSSGHLVLSQALLGESFEFKDMAVAFDLVLHLGTLLPVLFFYRRDLARIVRSLFVRSEGAKGGVVEWLKSDDARWLAVCVVVGTIPTALMGVLLKDAFEELFHSARAVSVVLLFTGALLFSTRFFARGETQRARALTLGVALAVGIAQGFAITPGISRSGSTIAVALLLGLDRELAARLSFLLSIPAILGATVLVARDGVVLPPGTELALLVGFLSSMLVGYAALVMLVALVRRGGLHNFAYYLWPVGIAGLVLTS